MGKGYFWIVRLCLVSLFFPVNSRCSLMHVFYKQNKNNCSKKQKEDSLFPNSQRKQSVTMYVSECEDLPNELSVEDPVIFMF